jgi:hypothetical protein
MRRSALALWAAMTALALTAGPAAAQSAGEQNVTDSTGAAQVGPTEVNAPVRVLSDGNNPGPSATVGGPQTTGNSNGAAQVGPTQVNAPVRVASDGDNNAAASGSAGGEQTVSDSNGSAQVGAAGASAPVRVASDGDNRSGGSGSSTTTGDTSTGAQGEPLAPLDGGTAAQGGPVELTGSLPPGAGVGDRVGTGGNGTGLRLAADFTQDAAGTLPLTGLRAGLVFALGLMFLMGGGVLRRGSVAAG